MSKPVPKPRPPPKPNITVGTKPAIAPKPRRPQPSAPAPNVKIDGDSAPPKRPFKPVHLSTRNRSNEVNLSNNNTNKERENLEVNKEDVYDDVAADTQDRNKESGVDQEDFYDDIVIDTRNKESGIDQEDFYDYIVIDTRNKESGIDQKDFYDDIVVETRNKESGIDQEDFYDDIVVDTSNQSENSDVINSKTKKLDIINKPPPPKKPLPQLPPSVGEPTQRLKYVPVLPGKEPQEALSVRPTRATKTSPQISPVPHSQSSKSQVSESSKSQVSESSKSQVSESTAVAAVQDQAVNDKDEHKPTVVQRLRPPPPPKPRWLRVDSKPQEQQEGSTLEEPAVNPVGSSSEPCVENSDLDSELTSNDKIANDEPCAGDEQFDNKPSRPIKKRMATRRQAPGQSTPVPISIDPMKRRPPPPPPEDSSPPKRAGSLKGPALPKEHLKVNDEGLPESRSTENIPKTAEEQSPYSYAYDHTFISVKSPKDSPVSNPDSTEEDGSYCEPDTSAVSGFMNELKCKDVSDGTYEFPEEEAVPSHYTESGSVSSENEYAQPEDIINGDDEDTDSDSDDVHDYEIPCDSPPPIPPHKSPLRSGSYDVTPPDNQDTDSDEEDDYVEPPDAQGFSEEESDGDTFIGDNGSFEEPLYQVYTARTLKRDRTLSRKVADSSQTDTSFDDLTKGTLRNMRMLWCEVPDVIASGILESIDSNERKRQEAMFEVITSEASYLKSLNILESLFINSPELTTGTPQSVLEKAQHHILFSNVRIVIESSQKFLDTLRQRSSVSLVVSSISDIIEEFATKHFEVYVKYCSNQIYQDRVLKELRKFPRFVEGMERLEKSAAAQCLSLQSFLVLPMQRITRLPLLVNAICHRCEPGSDDFINTDAALKAIHKVVRNCNEGARKMERMEEMVALQPQIEFTSKPIALVSANRWLLRRGEVVLVIEQLRSPISKKKLKLKPVYMFLFNDLLLITKKKSENRYRVLDYAARNMTKVEESSDPAIQLNYLLSLILLENCNNKTKDFLFCAESETDKTRWREAFNPPKAEQEGEKVYGTWDCPQIQAIHDYTPQQPDELALHEGDVINVQRKLPDGWYYGERLCDGVCGWFPANYTENILNEHVRARNLLQRYRLLAASKHLIGAVQTMKAPKTSKLTLKGISTTLRDPKRETMS